ncbi:hypothetical protein ACEXOS_005525 [Herbiconiux sp. P16]|uniref:hypothetical protein n=1 Tax=Herbiconiux wuyangfengii TaxID=3342794 RepID=UPI0035BA9F1E
MWETFWPDILVAIVGAIFGSMLTVGIALGTFFITFRRREDQALGALIKELHERRAVAQIGTLREIPEAAILDDFARANRSVISLRDEIGRTRDLVGPTADLQAPLSAMRRACNRYLETSSVLPERYWYLLDDLRVELSAGVHDLAKVRRRLPRLEPGGGAF